MSRTRTSKPRRFFAAASLEIVGSTIAPSLWPGLACGSTGPVGNAVTAMSKKEVNIERLPEQGEDAQAIIAFFALIVPLGFRTVKRIRLARRPRVCSWYLGGNFVWVAYLNR